MHQDAWLTKHPYLQAIAYLHAQVDAEVGRIQTASPPVPDWDNYINDFQASVPLLHSSAVGLDLTTMERILRSLVERLAANHLPELLVNDCRTLHTELRHEGDAPRRAIGYLLGKENFVSACPGLLHYLGWTALAHYLRPLVDAFASWRQEEGWLRSYCPTCGSPPTMGQLVGTDPARRRLLFCGRCRTRWQYRRTGCPFCENRNEQYSSVLTAEGEAGLRIDYCRSCNAYLKTYDGEGNEEVLLADWTSIHLDFAARSRGLKRMAASLYQL